MISFLAEFHFLRPSWLWLLIPVAAIVFMLWRQQSATQRWRSVIAPHLLEHLVVRPKDGSWLRPSHLLGAVLVLAVVAVTREYAAVEPDSDDERAAGLAELGAFARIYERIARLSGPRRRFLRPEDLTH